MAARPLENDHKIKRVEIVIFKYKEDPSVIGECLNRLVNYTQWPFKLTVYDNRMNPANFSKLWNRAIKESLCEYVLIMDSDCFVPQTDPCWLTRMMESIDEKGIVVPMCENAGGTNKATTAEQYPSSMPQNGVWGGPMTLYRKDVFEKVGWFDERFYIYGQDSEFSHRVLHKFGGAIYRTDVVVEHVGNHSVKKADEAGEIDREAEKIYSNTLFRLITQGRV